MKMLASLVLMGACTLSPEVIKDVETLEETAVKTVMDVEGIPQPPLPARQAISK